MASSHDALADKANAFSAGRKKSSSPALENLTKRHKQDESTRSERVRRATSTAQRSERSMAMMYCDVDLKSDGARQAKVEEPLAWAEEYPIQWRELRVDLAELAKLRWIEGLSRDQLAIRYGRTVVAIQNYFQELRRREFDISGLSAMEIEQIKHIEKIRL